MTLVWTRWVEELIEALRASAKPGPTVALLSARLAEGGGTNQRLPGVGPAVGMGAMGVVVVQISGQTGDEFLGRCEVAAFQEATGQGAEPQFDLVEPRTVLGREVEHMLVSGVGEKGATLHAGAQGFLVERQAVESRHDFTNLQAPMGVQIVENPMETLVVRELRGNVRQMGGEIHAGACHAQVPHDLAGGHDERSDQAARTMTDVFMLAFFGFAWLDRDRGMFALENLHAGLFVAAEDQLTVLIQDGCLDVQLANVLSFGVEIGVVTVEPVDALVRLEVGFVQDAPDGGAMHRFVGVAIDQFGGEIVKAPLAGEAIMCRRFAGSQREDFELFLGGKSSVADPTAEHLAGQRSRAVDSVFARA